MQQNFEGWQVHTNALRKMAEHPNAKSQLDIIKFASIELASPRAVKTDPLLTNSSNT